MPLPGALAPLQRALAEGLPLLETDAYPALLRSCGVRWARAEGVAARRCVLARRPAVLCLQLRRAFWAPHGRVKIRGHVAFPLGLDLGTLPALGQQGPLLAGEGGAPAEPPSGPAGRYTLRAVVVHGGLAEGGGHYAALRALSPPAQTPAQWVSASDQEVTAVSEAEVLAAEATLLFYQACGA